jgi:hypothetical protein
MMNFSCAAHRATVARGELRQCDVRVFEEGTILALASALGPPRLWGYGLDAVFEGLEEGLLRPHDGRAVTRLHQGLDAASTRLKARVEALIERRRCDVGLVAMAFERGQISILSVGPVRAYLRRSGQVRRLSQREDRADGLLKARPSFCTERVEPNDLVLGGSLAAFCDESLRNVASALAEEPDLAPQRVTELLNRSAATSGLGVSSMALRVPQF